MNAPQSLPFDPEKEEGLIASMMLDPELIDELASLNESVFYVPKCRIVFQVLKRFRATGQPVEFDFVCKALAKDKLLQEIDGEEGLNKLWSSVPTATNWRAYFEDVQDLYRRRTGILGCQKLIGLLSNLDRDVTRNVQELIEQTLVALSLEASARRHRSYPQILDDSLELIEQRAREPGLLGARFGLDRLDKCLGGLPLGSVTIVGAVTSGGKSALAMQAVLATAKRGQACVVFSLEMPAEQIALRHLAFESEVSFGKIWKGTLEKIEFEKIQEARSRLSTLPIHLEDDFSADINSVVTRCRQLKAKEKIELVVVDYLQLLSGAPGREQSREREVAFFSRRLRNMANELSVAVISLSQLNDEGFLRESRTIGQDADNVLIIEVPDDNGHSEWAIRIKKQRNGPRDLKIPVKFFGQYMRFE